MTFTLEQIGHQLTMKYNFNPEGYGTAICPSCGTKFLKNHPRRVFCDLGCKRKDRVKRSQQWRTQEIEIQEEDLSWEDEGMTIQPWMLVRGKK